MIENDPKKRSLPAEDAGFTEEDAHLAAALRSLAQEIQPEPGFQAELEKKLMKNAQRNANQSSQPATNWKRVLVWAALAAVFLFGLSWVFRYLMPRDNPPAASPEIPLITATPAATAAVSVLDPTQPPALPTDLASPTPLGTVYALSNGPDYDFVLQVDWPDSPAQVTVYKQTEWDKLTIESARLVAAKLGLNGEVYTSPYGEPGDLSYRVQDGERNVTFSNSSASYTYDGMNSSNIPIPNCQPPCTPVASNGVLAEIPQ